MCAISGFGTSRLVRKIQVSQHQGIGRQRLSQEVEQSPLLFLHAALRHVEPCGYVGRLQTLAENHGAQLPHVLGQVVHGCHEVVDGLLAYQFGGEVVLEVVVVLAGVVHLAVVLAYIRHHGVVYADEEKRLGAFCRRHLLAPLVKLEDGVLHAVFGEEGELVCQQAAREHNERWIDIFI